MRLLKQWTAAVPQKIPGIELFVVMVSGKSKNVNLSLYQAEEAHRVFKR
jgi:hypothetical protein